MSSDYLTILQLAASVDGATLDRAYGATVARFERLTVRGPLRYYRNDLLEAAAQAYEGLKRGRSQVEKEGGVRAAVLLKQGTGVMQGTRQGRALNINAGGTTVGGANKKVLDGPVGTKGPVRSAVKSGSILSNE